MENMHSCPTGNQSAEVLMSRRVLNIHFRINLQMVKVSQFKPALVLCCCPFWEILSSLSESKGSSGKLLMEARSVWYFSQISMMQVSLESTRFISSGKTWEFQVKTKLQ